MRSWFDHKTFLKLLSGLIAVAGIVISFEVVGVDLAARLVIVACGLAVLAALAAFTGFYPYFVHLAVKAYSSIMRRLAKHAVRSSLKQAMTPMACVGIMDREGTVHLKIRIAEGVYAGNGSQLRVVEATNDEPWGIIEVVQVTNGDYAICKPVDRQNVEFWQSLERRMKTDTSPPQNIRIVREFPPDFLEPVEKLLNEWR